MTDTDPITEAKRAQRELAHVDDLEARAVDRLAAFRKECAERRAVIFDNASEPAQRVLEALGKAPTAADDG